MEVWISSNRLSKIPNKTDPKTIKICTSCSQKFRITKICTEICQKCSGYPDRKERKVEYKVHEYKIRRPALLDKQAEYTATWRKNKGVV